MPEKREKIGPYQTGHMAESITYRWTMRELLRQLLWVPVLAILFCFGCSPTLKKEAQQPEEALNPIRMFYPRFQDDTEFASLIEAIRRNFLYLDKLDADHVFLYGPHRYTCRQVRETQEEFIRILAQNPDPDELDRKIKKNFRVYRAAGRAGNPHVLFTGYFEPTYEAKLSPDETFRYPIYRRPEDLVAIDLSLFDADQFEGKRIVARLDGREIVPYFTRRQIEVERRLGEKNLEIAYLRDPVDVAFLHIQGSGRLMLPDGRTISVGYHASNGRPYRSIGKYMIDKEFVTREMMSMQTIRRYLAEHPEIIEDVLNHNPSYVFFRRLETGPLGNLNVPVTPGRSLALDSRLFPKGALCFLSSQKPVVDRDGEIVGWSPFSRFVLNQDTGGAIKGAGRADLFWGSDSYAQVAAGHMKHEGDLYVLIKKSF
jgi:membrane-bound lytic murein transglycosylase A